MTFITRMSLPRRTFLRGLGTTMALPLLDAMTPALRAASAEAKPIRLGYVYTPNGIIGSSQKTPRPFLWTPRQEGLNFEFSPAMKPLEPFRKDMVAVSGMAQANGWGL